MDKIINVAQYVFEEYVRPYDHVWDMYYDEFEDEVME